MSKGWHRCAGGLVVTDDRRVLMIEQRFRDAPSQVTFPKGHLEPGEDEVTAARREIVEETGVIAGPRLARLPRLSYRFRDRGKRRAKSVGWYLFGLEHDAGGLPEPVVTGDEGIVRAWWTPLDHAVDALTHASMRPLVRAAIDVLRDRHPA